MKIYLDKLVNFITSLTKPYYPPLNPYELAHLKMDKPTIDRNIELIDLHIKCSIDSNSFHLEPDKEFYKKPLSKQAAIILNKIGLPPVSFKINFRNNMREGGLFIRKLNPVLKVGNQIFSFVEDDSMWGINISDKFEKRPKILSAILSHELTHLYFYKKGLSELFSTKIIEEQACDLTIFLLGLGKLFLNGLTAEKVEHYGDYEITSIINSYLPWYHLAYIYERVNFKKRISQNISRKNMTGVAIARISRVANHRDLIES
jgi:hypothetical protein